MIIGLGIDLVDLRRLRKTVERFGDRFLDRIFTKEEVESSRRMADPIPSLAGKFAAKEAAMKALGTGYSRGVWFCSIEVVRRPGGPPSLRLHDGARLRAEALGVTRSTVSITHEREMAAAVVVLEKD